MGLAIPKVAGSSPVPVASPFARYRLSEGGALIGVYLKTLIKSWWRTSIEPGPRSWVLKLNILGDKKERSCYNPKVITTAPLLLIFLGKIKPCDLTDDLDDTTVVGGSELCTGWQRPGRRLQSDHRATSGRLAKRLSQFRRRRLQHYRCRIMLGDLTERR